MSGNPASSPVPNVTPSGGQDNSKDLIAYAMGGIVIVALLAFIYLLFGQLSLPDAMWTRAVYLLTGIESVAFAGAGFLFGKEVNRARAENAEGQAAESKKRADESDRLKSVAEKKFSDKENDVKVLETVYAIKKEKRLAESGVLNQTDLEELENAAKRLFAK